jgi:putative flippase GtrA
VKFCIVGFSGLLVNVAVLFALADVLQVHTNVSAAIAIEISICTNFLLNDRWTFADKVGRAGAWWVRVARFHAVSAVGAVLQWVVFVSGNYLIARMTIEGFSSTAIEVVTAPPEVGGFKYLSQFVGIGLAAVWNFVANLVWTWRQHPESAE